ncbi:5'-methylthioadenosine/S-adenosylhomocysteine nucleosidase [Halioglobus japonicus]|nr:5'-methylthioadenosine/S-adenosylhomocysteine nucleosidase [Halioglobus japonicus]
MTAVYIGKPAISDVALNPIRRIAIFSAMASELKAVRLSLGIATEPREGEDCCTGAYQGVTVVTAVTGEGLTAAQKSAEVLFTHFGGAIDHVFVVGRASAYDLRHKIGEVITPEVVVDRRDGIARYPINLSARLPLGVIYSSDKQSYDDEYIADLNSNNVSVIDRNSGAISAVCQRYGCPITIVRAVSDQVDLRADPLDIFRPPEGQDYRAMVRFALRRPRRIAYLIATALGFRKAVAASSRELLNSIDRLIQQGSAPKNALAVGGVAGPEAKRPLLAGVGER